MVTWRDVGDAVQFELYGKPESHTDSWLAVGFSDDARMVGCVLSCFELGIVI